MFTLAITHLVLVTLLMSWIYFGFASVPKLIDEEPLTDGELPSLTIVFGARNEEAELERALRSLIAIDYPDLEIIAVNDRSTDTTGEIMDRVGCESDRLQIIHNDSLPEGWLGKNYVLQLASQQASGEYILMTDADVSMKADALRRAMAFAKREDWDHVAGLPHIDMPTALLQCMGIMFFQFFSILFKPWKARDPRSKAHVGIGAFNLVKTAVYRDIGMHEPIKMRPDDDVRFGWLIKKHGYRQCLVNAADCVSVPWYTKLRDMIVGLEKNSLAGLNYHVWLVPLGMTMLAAFFLWPLVAPFVLASPACWIYASVNVVILIAMMVAASDNAVNPFYTVLYPLTIVLLIWATTRATVLTLWQRGIYWRGTFYSLKELRANTLD